MGPKVATVKAGKRKYSFTSEQRINDLKQIRLKKRSEKKMYWGVTAYNDWRNARLQTYNYDYCIYMSDLNDLPKLDRDTFEYSMLRFIPEVTKKTGEPYPGRTLYQLCASIQKYLNVNKIPWKLVKGTQFQDLQIVLDNVMKERAEANIGMVKKQAEVITYDVESELWDSKKLGEETPDQLRDTVMFLIGMNRILRAGDKHYFLRRNMPNKPSQLQFREKF